jgi:hypothetical protein
MKRTLFNICRLLIFKCTLLIIFVLYFSSCKKDSFITSSNAQITTSTDTLKYDTVFTSVGSVTRSFKINNLNSQKLLLNKIKLMNGQASAFKININGVAASEVNNIEIAANDSMYVFVTVTINPNTANLPFIVKDSVLIMFNGNSRFVQLEAYGQNAIFLKNQVIKGNVTWTNKMPYVLLGSLRIDTTALLTIEAGCKIYLHADAPFIVDGTLVVNGTKQENVFFSGDRLDTDYKGLPAGWPGIYCRGSSKNNVLKYAVIENAYQAVVAEQPSGNAAPKLTLHQCVINNAYDAGLLCVNSSMYADNSLITNCGTNISFVYGGDYKLTNCTVASYSNNYIIHKKAVLSVTNAAQLDGSIVTADLSSIFTNCIFWGDDGSVENEIAVNKEGNNAFNVIFNHCLYKAKTDPLNTTINEAVKNTNPLFDSINVSKQLYNLHISNSNAPGVNKGINGTGFAKDLDDNNRSVGLPDIGCYEKQ